MFKNYSNVTILRIKMMDYHFYLVHYSVTTQFPSFNKDSDSRPHLIKAT